MTDPQLNKYFQDRRIRRYLLNAGLINRHGDIVSPTAEQVARARRATQQQIADDRERELERIQQRDNPEQTDSSVQRSLAEKRKSDSKHTRRGASRNLSSIRRSPLSPSGRRSLKRTKSAHQRSQDVMKHSNCDLARPKSPVKKLCRVTMVYYGPRTNFDYDNCWFKPDGDEITILQQHCGGENLTVFKGHAKPNETFSFDSRRHPDYPFALALYVNGLVNCRISVCCECKHKLNVPLGGKQGLFGIRKLQKVTACPSCQYKQQMKQSQSKEIALKSASSRYRQSAVRHSSSGERTPTPSHGSFKPKRHSPDISRTPSPHHQEKDKTSSNNARARVSSPEDKEKRPPVSSNRSSRVDYNTTAHHSTAVKSRVDDSDTSDFEGSNDNDLATSNARFGQPRISETYSDDDQESSHSPIKPQKIHSSKDEHNVPPSKIQTGKTNTPNQTNMPPSNLQRKADSSGDDDDDKNRISHGSNYTSAHSNKLPTSTPRRLNSSEDEANNQPSKTMTTKNNTISYTKKSSANTKRLSPSSGNDDNDDKKRISNKDNNTVAHAKKPSTTITRKLDTSEDEANDQSSKKMTAKNNTVSHTKKSPLHIERLFDSSGDDDDKTRVSKESDNNFDHARKPPSTIPRKFDSSKSEENDRSSNTMTGKTSTVSPTRKLPTIIQRKSEFSDDDDYKHASSVGGDKAFGHPRKTDLSDDENNYFRPKTAATRKNIADDSQNSLFGVSRKSSHSPEHENNRFSSSAAPDHHAKDRWPLSNTIDRKSTDTHHVSTQESKTRRLSTDSFEDFFNDKPSSAKAKPTTAHAPTTLSHQTTKKPDSVDIQKNNLESGTETGSWLTDIGSDQDN